MLLWNLLATTFCWDCIMIINDIYDFLWLASYMSHILKSSNVAFALIFTSAKRNSKPWLSYPHQWHHNVKSCSALPSMDFTNPTYFYVRSRADQISNIYIVSLLTSCLTTLRYGGYCCDVIIQVLCATSHSFTMIGHSMQNFDSMHVSLIISVPSAFGIIYL